jgi:hypothetical protein
MAKIYQKMKYILGKQKREMVFGVSTEMRFRLTKAASTKNG